MEEEFDLQKFVEMFDVAMTSNNPTVRKAFKNLMLVVAMVGSEESRADTGPLKSLLDEISKLSSRVSVLETSRYYPNSYNLPTPTITTTNNTPTWVAPTYGTYTLNQNEIDKWASVYTNLTKKEDE